MALNISGLKSRFGFGSQDDQAASSYDDYGYGSNEAYDDYGEYGYDSNTAYDDYAYGAHNGGYSADSPKLITSDDIRAHTQYTPSDDFESTPQHARATYGSDRRNSVTSRPAGVSPSMQSASQSVTGAYSAASTGSIPQPSSSLSASSYSYADGRATQRAPRIITPIKPTRYEDAERIAKVLKSGDVAVLFLGATSEELGHRILDFSFGVACALDAQVECIASRVFAITRGAALSDEEIARLKDQGLV